MEVYQYRWVNAYGGGLMWIAANDRKEADKLAKREGDHWYYHTTRADIKCVSEKTKGYVIASEHYQE